MTDWPENLLKRSTVDTKRTMSVAQHFENPIGSLGYRFDQLSIRFATSREPPAEHTARVHALNLR